jgi:hypothetical protein
VAPPKALHPYISKEEWNRLRMTIYQILCRGIHHNDLMSCLPYLEGVILLLSFAGALYLDALVMYLLFASFILVLVQSGCCHWYRQCALAEDELRSFLARYSIDNEAGLTLQILEDGPKTIRLQEEKTVGFQPLIPVDYILGISILDQVKKQKLCGRKAMEDNDSPSDETVGAVVRTARNNDNVVYIGAYRQNTSRGYSSPPNTPVMTNEPCSPSFHSTSEWMSMTKSRCIY